MKTKEELSEIKEEVEKLDKKLHELTEEELEQVTGGTSPSYDGESSEFRSQRASRDPSKMV